MINRHGIEVLTASDSFNTEIQTQRQRIKVLNRALHYNRFHAIEAVAIAHRQSTEKESSKQ